MNAQPEIAPQPLSGQSVEIFVADVWKASGVLEDPRYVDPADRRVHEQVHVQLEDYDEDWARQLPRAGRGEERGAVNSILVDLKIEDGRNYLGARLGRPWAEQIGARVEDLAFPLEHHDL